ncbi:J domain-containing protein [Halomonas venusta]|uniref:J domain-containing protein n=1 Tax=Vreelandella venusta TaxID=44935 RepID=UPI00295F261C|nr:J domain-containing protein [Halomonas venusta]MDW0357748.1 J domain-containing protein [Halomonas venusta]
MTDISASPLSWPPGKPRTPANDRKQGRFGKRGGSGYGLKELTVAEARSRVTGALDKFTRSGQTYRVPPDSIIISTNLALRNDGYPRSGQREPSDPGAAVYFQLDGQNQCIPCDVYQRIADNLAAIADCIEALRTLERHDASLMRAAFTGFAQLASPEAMGRPHWRTVLNTDSHDPEEVRKAYKTAQRATHPDRGGSSEAFHAVQEAWSQAKADLAM